MPIKILHHRPLSKPKNLTFGIPQSASHKLFIFLFREFLKSVRFDVSNFRTFEVDDFLEHNSSIK